MRKKTNSYYRGMRTTAEKRANQDMEYVRLKRSPHSLPDSYDDDHYIITKSWKDKRKTQYRCRDVGDGCRENWKNQIIMPSSWCDYELKEYFEEYDIPYRIEEIKSGYIYKRANYRNVRTKNYDPICWQTDKESIQAFLNRTRDNYESVFIGYTYHKRTTVEQYKITWWKKQDININRLLTSSKMPFSTESTYIRA